MSVMGPADSLCVRVGPVALAKSPTQRGSPPIRHRSGSSLWLPSVGRTGSVVMDRSGLDAVRLSHGLPAHGLPTVMDQFTIIICNGILGYAIRACCVRSGLID